MPIENSVTLSIISTTHNIDKEDFVRVGYKMNRYEVGKSFWLVNEKRETVFYSTPIVEIIDDSTFRTINTTYKFIKN